MTILNPGPQSFLQASARRWVVIANLAFLSIAVLLMLPGARGRWRAFHHLRHAVASHHLALIATALIVFACVCIYFLSQMVVVKAKVHDSVDPLEFSARRLPEFVQQNRNSKSLVEFRGYLDALLSLEYPDSLSKAVAIRCASSSTRSFARRRPRASIGSGLKPRRSWLPRLRISLRRDKDMSAGASR